VAEKVELARAAVQVFELPIVLSVLELARSTWYYHHRGRPGYEEKYAHLREPLDAIAREFSEYGYRRTQTELRESYGEALNHKVIRRLHGLWDLPLVRGTKAPKPSGVRRAIKTAGARANLLGDLIAIEPLDVFYTDFSEIVYDGGRAKAQLIPILDHRSKVALGWSLGAQGNSELALEAWGHAGETLASLGSTPCGCIVHHDQDSVFTGYAWTGRLLLEDGCRISYALNGPGDNPEMESFFGRFKTENRSLLLDAATMAELHDIIDQRMEHYNRRRRHSSLGNQAPWTYLQSWLSNQ
jgi:transposase InsO family protein